MNTHILAVTALFVLAQELPAQGILSRDTLPDTLRRAPSTAADSAALAVLRRSVPDLDTVCHSRYARLAQGWVPLADTASWPEDTETSLLIYRDARWRFPRAVLIAPVSQSGDWSLEDTYYFDPEGRTVLLRHFFGSFANDCDAPVVHETSSYWLSRGQLLAKEYSLTEGRNGKDLDPRQCRPPFGEPYSIAPDARALLQALGAGRFL